MVVCVRIPREHTDKVLLHPTWTVVSCEGICRSVGYGQSGKLRSKAALPRRAVIGGRQFDPNTLSRGKMRGNIYH